MTQAFQQKVTQVGSFVAAGPGSLRRHRGVGFVGLQSRGCSSSLRTKIHRLLPSPFPKRACSGLSHHLPGFGAHTLPSASARGRGMPKTARGDTRGCGTLPSVQLCRCKVLTAEPARHRNDLSKRVLLFWPVIWELCSEALPFVEQLKFAALFLKNVL